MDHHRASCYAEYHSLAIEIVTIVLMLIGTTNFAVLLLLVRRKWRQALQVFIPGCCWFCPAGRAGPVPRAGTFSGLQITF